MQSIGEIYVYWFFILATVLLIIYYIYSQYKQINDILAYSTNDVKFIIYDKELEYNMVAIQPINALYHENISNLDLNCKDKYCDEEIEWSRKLYNFEKEINNDISKLRSIEENLKGRKINYKDGILGINIVNSIYYKAFNSLSNYYLQIRTYEELNDRITFYYRFMNENKIINWQVKSDSYHSAKVNVFNIEVYQISKHHHAVEWVYKNVKSELGTILHIDSHADMNPVENNYKFIENCINNNDFSDINMENIFSSITKIGSVLVPLVMPYKKNNGIVWITPDWVKEPKCESNNIITTSESYCYFKGKCPIHYGLKYLEQSKKIYNENNKNVNISTYNLKEVNFESISKNVSKNYILNIDLDYFVTYGNDNYLPNGMDAISDFRTRLDYGYSLKADDKTRDKIVRDLLLEMNIIRKRIDNFLILVKKLKDIGKIPKIIIICDSTNVNFTNDHLCQSFIKNNDTELSNEFTPKYLCFWLHNTILRNLKEVFTN